MNPPDLNYRHLRYFWVTAQEGSFTRAAEHLDVAVQTVSVQIGLLEQALGAALLTPQGRRLVPTEAGRLALSYADEIFRLGERLRDAVQEASGKRALRLTVGISDALPKLIAYRLLQAVRAMPEKLSLVCHEGDFVDLIADLALHRLDVVLTDRPAAVSGSLRVYSHPLGECEISLFGTPALAANYRKNFPGCLQGAPVLLPTRENALRGRLDQWFAANDLHLDLAGEFDDNALLTTFGGGGLGLFPAPAVLANDIEAQFGAEPVGALSGVREQFYAISAERRIRHPGVEAIQAGARGLL